MSYDYLIGSEGCKFKSCIVRLSCTKKLFDKVFSPLNNVFKGFGGGSMGSVTTFFEEQYKPADLLCTSNSYSENT